MHTLPETVWLRVRVAIFTISTCFRHLEILFSCFFVVVISESTLYILQLEILCRD